MLRDRVRLGPGDAAICMKRASQTEFVSGSEMEGVSPSETKAISCSGTESVSGSEMVGAEVSQNEPSQRHRHLAQPAGQ